MSTLPQPSRPPARRHVHAWLVLAVVAVVLVVLLAVRHDAAPSGPGVLPAVATLVSS